MTTTMNSTNSETSSHVELLRFTTCGSVDDGKSTLIGRLLYDSKSLFDDQLEALERSSHMKGDEEINLANLTDGLRAEREQGITIDVAYRYFGTANRKFIVADTPGHIQYTRNMVTGASTANLALILVDARQGIMEQTRRHSFIASLLGISHLILCINKMDLVAYDREIFERIRIEFEEFSTLLEIKDIAYIPISALRGDNVVGLSANMPWYQGPPLLNYLETVHIANDRNFTDPRFPVQWVIRPRSDEHHDYRAYAGVVTGGVFHVGDDVIVLPSGKRSRIKAIHLLDAELKTAYPPMSVSLLLEHNIDISRGDMIVKPDNIPYLGQEFEATICWMSEHPMLTGRKYLVKHTTNTVKGIISELLHRININTLEAETEAVSLRLNEIGKIKFKTQSPLIFDEYKRMRETGAFILIDEATNATVGAGMLCEPTKTIPLPQYDGYVI